ncbi:carbon-nitrogen hydrolase family protein [Peribacillus asahii]|uniref:carbon-nitrogen hydrolase family protein n=1 Tax=Peribacillus asahii TaxID=228899 RepID=UPI0038004EED
MTILKRVKIALLHLLPIAGDIRYNQELIERSVKLASNKEVDWIITPELSVSGLQFRHKIGIDWIERQPNSWMNRFCQLVKSIDTTVFLGSPEKGEDGKYYNSVFVIDSNRQIIGKQRKINVLSDGWSTAGKVIEPITIDDIHVGIMICADAYTTNVAERLCQKGAEIIIAPASWGPGLHGPNGEWEQRSIETGLPIIVCNRTGEDETVSFWQAESSLIKNGERVFTHQSKQSAIITFEWNLERQQLHSAQVEVDYIE